MTVLRHILILLLLVSTVIAKGQPGQCPKIPESYKWETPEDYMKDRELVKKTLKWLCVTPYSEDIRMRALANAFVLEWLAGTPELTLNVKSEILGFPDEHPQLLLTFIHSMALYVLNHPKEQDEIKKYEAGIQTVVDLSMKSKELSKLAKVKEFEKMIRRSKLKKYLQESLKS